MAMSRSLGGASLTTLPPISISPWAIPSRPAIMRSRGDLPQPDGPTRTANCPSSMSISTPRSTWVVPKYFCTLRMRTDAIPFFSERAVVTGVVWLCEKMKHGWAPSLECASRSHGARQIPCSNVPGKKPAESRAFLVLEYLGQERPRPFAAWRFEELAFWRVLYDSSVVHEHDAVRDLPREPHLVRYHQHGH